ncbi:3-dehydroquinate synthase, partial [Candidatus Pelagibacter sp.]|nr:3-dehydroquinate synthase [Candidatus Pelagibacter sp.]
MKPIKLKVKTKLDNYSIIIGSNIIKNLQKYLNENSINYAKCLLVIDKKIPKKMISKITNSLKRKNIYKFLFNANEKN